MNVIYYKCNQERLQKTNEGANTMKGKEEVKQKINEMVIELEEMKQQAYDSVLSRNNVGIYGIICSNLGSMRCLQSKYNTLIMGHSKVFTDTYNEIEELYEQSLKAIKKLK